MKREIRRVSEEISNLWAASVDDFVRDGQKWEVYAVVLPQRVVIESVPDKKFYMAKEMSYVPAKTRSWPLMNYKRKFSGRSGSRYPPQKSFYSTNIVIFIVKVIVMVIVMVIVIVIDIV